jgi:hypothetical protein
MKKIFASVFYSFPVQLVLLHFKKFQALLIFWLVLFSTCAGNFMAKYGAGALFLAPEYLGKVNAISTAILGMALGIFVMSWNITSFILFSRYFRFLATTSRPFLKYCLNNFIIPLSFLIYYNIRLFQFTTSRELFSTGDALLLILGFLSGFVLIIIISLAYFFGADTAIISRLRPVLTNPKLFREKFQNNNSHYYESRLLTVNWYIGSKFRVRQPRDVSHYSREFIEFIFSRHHFSAVISIFIAFLFLIFIGFNLDSPVFQLPAAAGIAIFFAILIAVTGALSYFLQSWSLIFAFALYFGANFLYQEGYIDFTNKAFGLNYSDKENRPVYSSETLKNISTKAQIEADKDNMLEILQRWKSKQGNEKPVMVVINTSGGGNRSAAFTMNILQKLDSISSMKLMDQTVCITGASGGMLGAAYYRALRDPENQIADPLNPKYSDHISQNLLNALISSLVARDLVSPAQKFSLSGQEYVKDRAYAFEKKLNENTGGLLNFQLKDIVEKEANAQIPLMFLNSVISRDGRYLVISTQPVSFLMKPTYGQNLTEDIEPDAVDFASFFDRQNPLELKFLTALRMNATFPYVLPNVWLPSTPVIDVMDAGLRDNFGTETAIRFLMTFREWIIENTSALVIVQIADRKKGGWQNKEKVGKISDVITKPMLQTQENLINLQEFHHNEFFGLLAESFGNHVHRLNFEYIPISEDAVAALNFQLTRRERQFIADAVNSEHNVEEFRKFETIIKGR